MTPTEGNLDYAVEHSVRRRRILTLALPIIGGMVSQNVLNLVDTAMVGRLGNAALAAVGLGGFLNFLTSAMILGLSAGVQAMASRRVGEGRHEGTAVPLNGGLALAAAFAIPWSILLILFTPELYGMVTQDPVVVAEGAPYLRMRLFSMVALAMNYSFRGYWNAIDQSRLYMSTLIVMHVANIFLNWVLIFGNLGAPVMGTTGAGLASAISTFIGTATYFALALRHARGAGFLEGLPTIETLRTMMRLSVPAGLQQFFFAAGMTAFLAIVGRIGTAEVAATKVIIDLLLVGILPAIGFGIAAATLAGQALGRGEADEAQRWGWEVARLGTGIVALIGLPGLLFPELLLGIFMTDAETIALASGPMRLVAGLLAADAIGLILMNALIGAGDTRRVMLVSLLLQWAIFLPIAWLLGPILGFGLMTVWVAQIGYRSIQSGIFTLMWARGRWAEIRV